MDGSMDGSPKPNVCKFSSENWKILENLREEKRKLEEFDASALANSPDISAENEIKDESRIELHEKLEADEMNTSIVLDKKHEIKIEKYCRPSICDLKTYFTEEPANERLSNDGVVDLKESCVHSHDVNVDGVEDEKSISSRFDHNGMFSNVPEALRPFILCILSIPSFRQYIKEISKDISNIVNAEKDFPTISLFIDYFWKMSTFNLKYDSKCPENVFDTESLSSMMLTVFEILHEELVQARQKNIIKSICMADCRLVQKGNHTVVSHLFRGHYKKKIYCECDHVEVTKDFFTMINVSQDDIHYKSLIVNTLSHNGNGLVVRRYLYTVNNYSTVESLKEKFCSICKTSDTTNALTISSLMMALIVQHRIEKIISSEILIFDVMCEDGQIWLFNIHAGNIMLDYIENSKNVLLRSKETTPITTPRSSLLLGAIEIESIASNCKKSDYALVMVLLTWIDEIGDIGLQFLLQVPRVSNGLHIYERLARVIKFNHSDFQKVIISAKNKMNHCLICLNSCCEGCPVQMSDKVVLSDNYMVHVKFAMSSRDEMIETFDDDSMLLNEPINMLTIDECITQYLQRIDTQVCKSCMKNLPKHVKVEILKKPHVLCIHMPTSNKSKYSPTILAKERIDYLLGRSLKSRTYLLHVLKQYHKESPCLQKDAFESFPYPEAFEMFDSQSNEKTSTLFYLRNEGCKYERNKRLFRKFGGQEKQHNQCKTKFSPRSGQLTDRLGKKLYDTCEEFDCSSYGQYTPRSFSSMSQRTTCTCHRCQALGQFHAKDHVTIFDPISVYERKYFAQGYSQSRSQNFGKMFGFWC